MLSNKLPKGGNDFRMEGISGFKTKFRSLIRYGKFATLQDNKDEIENIFSSLVETIRRDGKIPYSTRREAIFRFMRISGTTKQDEKSLKELLDFYK